MSSLLIKKLYNEKLAAISKKDTRKQVESQKGQLIILNNINAFRSVFESYGIKLSNSDYEVILLAGRKKAFELENSFRRSNKRRFTALNNKLLKGHFVKDEDKQYTYIVSSFSSSLDSIKAAMMLKAEELSNGQLTNRSDIASKIHKGHGEEGLAVSQVSIAQGIAELIKLFDKHTVEEILANAIVSSEGSLEISEHDLLAIKDIATHYSQVVTESGALRASYASVITFQASESNLGDSAGEKLLKNIFFNKFVPSIINDIPTLKGSSTLKDKIIAVIIDNFKKAGAKVNIPIVSDLSTKSKASSKVKNKVEKFNVRVNKRKKSSIKKPKGVKKSKVSLRSLIPKLNRSLHDTIKQLMRKPSLQYRTGRFARSAKVTDITQTPKGYPSIAYTYMKYPYQIFEYPKGNPRLATVDRDPRNIIGGAVRELAKQQITSRFYTRRV